MHVNVIVYQISRGEQALKINNVIGSGYSREPWLSYPSCMKHDSMYAKLPLNKKHILQQFRTACCSISTWDKFQKLSCMIKFSIYRLKKHSYFRQQQFKNTSGFIQFYDLQVYLQLMAISIRDFNFNFCVLNKFFTVL